MPQLEGDRIDTVGQGGPGRVCACVEDEQAGHRFTAGAEQTQRHHHNVLSARSASSQLPPETHAGWCSGWSDPVVLRSIVPRRYPRPRTQQQQQQPQVQSRAGHCPSRHSHTAAVGRRLAPHTAHQRTSVCGLRSTRRRNGTPPSPSAAAAAAELLALLLPQAACGYWYLPVPCWCLCSAENAPPAGDGLLCGASPRGRVRQRPKHGEGRADTSTGVHAGDGARWRGQGHTHVLTASTAVGFAGALHPTAASHRRRTRAASWGARGRPATPILDD
mmetsp:Transcript_5251/g.12374  ORF Transcript_5251/g.12374 Transcript_5251/m.12374 type:complete len:275 (+) Transcript_5251:1280-2104(+)